MIKKNKMNKMKIWKQSDYIKIYIFIVLYEYNITHSFG